MINVKGQLGKFQGNFLVRDKNGKPKFDDIHNIPDCFWEMLTDKEKQEIIKQRG